MIKLLYFRNHIIYCIIPITKNKHSLTVTQDMKSLCNLLNYIPQYTDASYWASRGSPLRKLYPYIIPKQKGLSWSASELDLQLYWVAVKELKLSYHKMDTYIYIYICSEYCGFWIMAT